MQHFAHLRKLHTCLNFIQQQFDRAFDLTTSEEKLCRKKTYASSSDVRNLQLWTFLQSQLHVQAYCHRLHSLCLILSPSPFALCLVLYCLFSAYTQYVPLAVSLGINNVFEWSIFANLLSSSSLDYHLHIFLSWSPCHWPSTSLGSSQLFPIDTEPLTHN